MTMTSYGFLEKITDLCHVSMWYPVRFVMAVRKLACSCFETNLKHEYKMSASLRPRLLALVTH